MRRDVRTEKTIAVVFALAAWFLGHAWKGLTAYFQGDDAMNLYQAWILPPWRILAANLTPFTTVYRPLGTAFYRLSFGLLGWHPLGFRIAAYLLMLANIGLLYRVAKLVTGSTEIGILAALLGSYHPRLMDIYLNGGTIYDVLCYTFFLSALCLYLKKRPILFLICYILALNSKEMAASLPLILLAYEWIYRRRIGSVAAWLSLTVTAIAFFVKKSSPAFAHAADYGLRLSAHQFFATTRPLVAEVFYLSGGALNNSKTVLIFALAWGIALATRRKPLLFAAAFLTLTPLPINFIAYRGFFVMYLPLAGWAIYFATALAEGRDWLLKTVWKRPPLIEGSWEPERVGLFLFAAYVLFSIQAHDIRSFDAIDPSQANLRALHEGLAVRPNLPAGGRVLLLHDPFPRDVYDPVFVIRMNYEDASLSVDRGFDRQPGNGPYDLILDYDGRQYLMRKDASLPH
jgi:hypothetical protein